MKSEPALIVTGIIGAIMAIAMFALAMGWINWTPDQMSAFEGMLAAIGALVVLLTGGAIIRSQVYSQKSVEKLQGD